MSEGKERIRKTIINYIITSTNSLYRGLLNSKKPLLSEDDSDALYAGADLDIEEVLVECITSLEQHLENVQTTINKYKHNSEIIMRNLKTLKSTDKIVTLEELK